MNSNCVLLFGNDTYAIKKNLDQIFETSEIKEEDIEYYDYEEDGLESALQSAMTLPFLVDKKGVVLRNCTFLTDQKNVTNDETESLTRYCDLFNPTTVFCLTVTTDKLDYRKNIVKFLTKNIDFKQLNTKDDTDSIYRYIRNEVEKNGLTIESLALTQFVNRIGNDSDMLENELAKLITFALGRRNITSDMVYEIVTKDLDDNIFELTNAIIAKDMKKTMEIYNDLKSLKIDPIWMLTVITGKFQEILYTKELLKLKYKNEDIMKYFNASRGRVYYMVQNARNIEDELLVRLLENVEELDYKIKSGQIDKDLGIELFLLELE